jgi:hypothetical protein
MKLTRAMLLSTLVTASILGTDVTVSFGASSGRVPKEPPSTTSVVQVERSSNSANSEDKGGAVSSASILEPMYRPPQLVKYPKPIAMVSFWEKLAVCETNSNWQDKGTYAGGLGIYTKGKFGDSNMGTWERWGGEEFAPSPDKATKEEQIIVANRIATLGWKTTVHRDPDRARRMGVPVTYEYVKDPVGFTGWGCYKSKSSGKYRMAKPGLIAHAPGGVIGQKFTWGQTGRLVMDLQAILGLNQDGKYGAKTWAAHQMHVINNGMHRFLVPAPRLYKPKNVAYASSVKRCPQYEELLYTAGFPKNQIRVASYVMWKESRCIPTVSNSKDPKGGSYGLMQINGFWVDKLVSANIIASRKDLFIPEKNAKAAFYVWSSVVLNGRYSHGWSAWNIY